MRINPRCKLRDIAGEKVIILQGRAGADMTQLVTLNSSAEWLFNQLSAMDSFEKDDVNKLLRSHYDVDDRTARRDADAWFFRLLELGVID
ncbi:MAG: PqqD family protein [Rikenellaceae bacterium]|jgi:hypothetical protein|nr:PqqD family protein [Rikenellaceae bacterium]